jgi:hypothetical protein
VIAGIAVVAVIGLHPTTRMAERFLEREGISASGVPPDLEEALPSLIGDQTSPVG